MKNSTQNEMSKQSSFLSIFGYKFSTKDRMLKDLQIFSCTRLNVQGMNLTYCHFHTTITEPVRTNKKFGSFKK